MLHFERSVNVRLSLTLMPSASVTILPSDLPAIVLMSLSTSMPLLLRIPSTPFFEVIGARRLLTACAKPLLSMKYARFGRIAVNVFAGAASTSSTKLMIGLKMLMRRLSFASSYSATYSSQVIRSSRRNASRRGITAFSQPFVPKPASGLSELSSLSNVAATFAMLSLNVESLSLPLLSITSVSTPFLMPSLRSHPYGSSCLIPPTDLRSTLISLIMLRISSFASSVRAISKPLPSARKIESTPLIGRRIAASALIKPI